MVLVVNTVENTKKESTEARLIEVPFAKVSDHTKLKLDSQI